MKKHEKVFYYMESWDDGNLPDGAWWAMLEDGVKCFNEEHGTKYDPFDTVHEYVAFMSD